MFTAITLTGVSVRVYDCLGNVIGPYLGPYIGFSWWVFGACVNRLGFCSNIEANSR